MDMDQRGHSYSHLEEGTEPCVSVLLCPGTVLAGSPSRGGNVAVYVPDINQPSLPTPFYSVLVSISVFMALFNCISVHKSFRQFSAFSLSSSRLFVLFCALLVVSAVYLFIKVCLALI